MRMKVTQQQPCDCKNCGYNGVYAKKFRLNI